MEKEKIKMKAFLILDELNQFHWAMLKSILFILSLLPIVQVSLNLWLGTEGSSQIMIGFFALSIVSAWFMVSFVAALKASVWQCKTVVSKSEQFIFKGYRYIPMLFLTSLVSYLTTELALVL